MTIVAMTLASVVVFCAVQDRVMTAGISEYVQRQTAALRGRAPVTVDGVMRPWVAKSVRRGLLWGVCPLLAGFAILAFGGRRG